MKAKWRYRFLAASMAAALSLSANVATADVTLTWWDYYGWNPNIDKAVNDLITKYEAAHPGVNIERTSIGFGDFRTKLIQAAATGNFPNIAFVDQGDIPVFATQGVLADLTPYLEAWPDRDKYLPNVIRGAVYQGKGYGVPFVTNTTVLWYNKDLLAEAGIDSPPATWEELREKGKALTKGTVSGFCFAAAPTEEGTFTFLPFLWQAGGDVPTIGDEASVNALNFVNDLLNTDGVAPRSILSWAQPSVGDQFIAGNCAMMVNGPWMLAAVGASNINWGLASWPEGVKAAAPLGGESAVVANDENVEAAWDVIRWISDPANLTDDVIRESGMLPNRTDTVNTERWVYNPTIEVFANQVEVALPRSVYGSKYAQISEQIWTMVQKVLTGASSAQDAATEAGEAIKPLLE